MTDSKSVGLQTRKSSNLFTSTPQYSFKDEGKTVNLLSQTGQGRYLDAAPDNYWMRDDKSVTSFQENALAGSTPVLCRYTFTDLDFSAFILLKQAIRDNVSDTSNLQSELITQPETPISVSLSLARQVISKELLRHIFECNHTNTLCNFSLPLFVNPFLAYIVCELYRRKCA